MNNAWYLFSASTIAWIIIFLYSYGISKKQKSLENQMAEMKEALRKCHISGSSCIRVIWQKKQ